MRRYGVFLDVIIVIEVLGLICLLLFASWPWR
jgi:hypothetical protein